MKLTKNLEILSTSIKVLKKIVKKEKFSFGFDIADRCPNGCHCYWRFAQRVEEMTDEKVINFFKKKKEEGFLNVFIIGGEPYVRPDLLEKVAGIIPITFAITSGTVPFRHLKSSVHIVSIDGKDALTHDTIRKGKNLYNRIINNLKKAMQKKFPVFLHTVLNAINYTQTKNIIEVWEKNGLADGIVFSTMTPIAGVDIEHLRLNTKQREYIVKNLLQLKSEYPAFLLNTKEMIKKLHPEVTKNYSQSKCLAKNNFIAYDAAGKEKDKCIFGADSICSECGCVVTTMTESMNSLYGFLSALPFVMKWPYKCLNNK